MANQYTTTYSTTGDYAAPTRVNYTPESLKLERLSYRRAKDRAASMGLKPQDFGGTDWNYQTLSDALNVNITNGKGGRLERILANPTSALSIENDLRKLVGNQFNATQSQYGQLGTPNQNFATDFSALSEKAKRYGLDETALQNIAQDEYNLQQRWDTDPRKQPYAGPGGFTGFMDKALQVVVPAATAYIGGGVLSNLAGFGNAAAFAPGTVPTASAPVMIPGTEIPLSTAANVGRTAYNVARSDDPARALTNAAFRYGSNFQPSSDWRNLSVFQDLGERYGVNLGQPDFGTNVKTPDIVPQNFDKGGKYESEIRPTPEQRPTVGALARLLQQADTFVRKPFGYDNPPVQVASDFLMIPQLYRTMENYAYGSPLTHGTSSVSRYLPRLNEDTKGAIEASLNLVPLVGPAARAAKSGAGALAKAGERLAERTVPPIMERGGVGANLLSALASGTTSNVIKPKGGNWLAGHVDRSLDRLRRDNTPILSGDIVNEAAGRDLFSEYRKVYDQDPTIGLHDWMRTTHPDIYAQIQNPEDRAINRWIDTKLDKYIRNEMATPEDPVRALAERGTLHVDPNELNYRLNAYGKYPQPGQEFMAASDAAKMWEGTSDNAINVLSAGQITRPDIADARLIAKNPWLTKLPPETNVYATMEADTLAHDLGFPHLIDELKAAMSPTSDLPQHLRLDPKDIDKVTVPQAVERVAKINAWRAEQAAQAEKAGMMANLQATPRLADESLQLSFVEKPGGAWVDIPETINEKGMRLCTSIGKAGGWCTKNEGLAKTYGSGENRLTALVDAEGRPHAQAKITTDADHLAAFEAATETLTPQQVARWEDDMARIMDRPPELEEGLDWMEHNAPEAYTTYKRILADQGKNSLPDITELKPPGNSFNSERAREYAKRDPQYKNKVTQSVLNFLNSGEWGKVRDLDHYGIVDLKEPNSLMDAMKTLYGDESNRRIGQEFIDAFNHAVSVEPNAPRFMTQRQLRDFIGPIEPLEGYAEGGKKKPSPFDELEPTFGDRMGAAAADKLTEAGLWLYDKLADRDKLSSAHKIYLDTFVHDNRAPITAKDFNPQDLVELQNLIRQKEKLTGGRGTGYIQYEDYKTLPGGDQRRGVAANLTGGVLPPRASLSKSLGQFNYQRDPKTGQYRIIDEYDFNPQTITAGGEKVEVPPEFYGDYVETAGFSPYALARLYGGRKMPPGKGRKVELSVPGKAEGGLMKYNPDEVARLAASVVPGYAAGGIVSEDQAGVNRMVDQQNAAEGGYMAYAAGGLVNYDPAEIDTIVSRIREELHG